MTQKTVLAEIDALDLIYRGSSKKSGLKALKGSKLKIFKFSAGCTENPLAT